MQNRAVSLTLFAFDTNEEISSHESKGDAMVQILDGKEITIGDGTFSLCGRNRGHAPRVRAARAGSGGTV
ncbi:MAG: hypothetical protein R2912_04670 [Eubacteriales bacterium]